MARGVNLAILIGNCGADPETRAFPSGGSVTNLRLATSESWKDKDTGEQKERTEWHRVTLYGKLGEIAAQYLRKGSQVYIEGKIRTRTYEKEGQTHYATEIIANNMQMLGSRASAEDGEPARPAGSRPAVAPASQSSAPAPGDLLNTSEVDDDVPF